MIKPMEDRILVKWKQEEKRTESGIILSEEAREEIQIAKVIAIGPGKYIEGKKIPMNIKEGEKIIFTRFSGTEVQYQGEKYYIVRQSDVLAIIE